MAQFRLLLVSCLAGVIALASGCFSSDEDPFASPAFTTQGMPTFSGPWAEQFTWAYGTARSVEARAVLEDEVITRDEIALMNQLVSTCLVGLGFSDVDVHGDGSMNFVSPNGVGREATDAMVESCGESTGWNPVSKTYAALIGNPENRDVYSLMAACLVRVGLEEAGYSAEQFRADFEGDRWTSLFATEEGMDLIESFAYRACNSDPSTDGDFYSTYAACFVAVGYREPGYTGAQFREEQAAGLFKRAVIAESSDARAADNCWAYPTRMGGA